MRKFGVDRGSTFATMVAFGLAAAMGAFALLSGLVAPNADAQEEDGIHIMGKGNDTTSGFTPVSLDVENNDNQIDGFVHLRSPVLGKDSQLWSMLATDVLGANEYSILLRSKKSNFTLCLARDEQGRATTRPCGDDNTHWDALLRTPSTWILRQTIPRNIFSRDIKLCLTARGDEGAAVPALDCTPPQFFADDMIWTFESLAVISQPSTSPSSPPMKPTGCKLFGTATCSLVGFNCNPLSAADTIVVTTSTNIGVSVTNVESKLGLINGKYLNEGQASVAICASKAGMHACSDAFDVTFGNTVCSAPGHPIDCPGSCPAHQIKCGCDCKPPANCRHPQ